jgi:hypothetical protein
MEADQLREQLTQARETIAHLSRSNAILSETVAKLSSSRLSSSQPSLTSNFQDFGLQSRCGSVTSKTISITRTPTPSRSQTPAKRTHEPTSPKKSGQKTHPRKKSKDDPSNRPSTSKPTENETSTKKSKGKTDEKIDEKPPKSGQQCIACGEFDPNNNIARHFKRNHDPDFNGRRVISTTRKIPVCPDSMVPDAEVAKKWKNVNWTFLGIKKPKSDQPKPNKTKSDKPKSTDDQEKEKQKQASSNSNKKDNQKATTSKGTSKSKDDKKKKNNNKDSSKSTKEGEQCIACGFFTFGTNINRHFREEHSQDFDGQRSYTIGFKLPRCPQEHRPDPFSAETWKNVNWGFIEMDEPVDYGVNCEETEKSDQKSDDTETDSESPSGSSNSSPSSSSSSSSGSDSSGSDDDDDGKAKKAVKSIKPAEPPSLA